jgi:hypothetical protein
MIHMPSFVQLLMIAQDLRHLSDVLDSIQDKIGRIGADVLEVRSALRTV